MNNHCSEMTNCDFTYKHYIETLLKARKTHIFYTFANLQEKSRRRFIILRHDIDAQVWKALKMAKIDSDLGISATFFVRVHGPYNPFREPSYEAILKIVELGHEIGFHYEPLFYTKNNLPLEETILLEIRLLNKLFKISIRSIAPHMPSLLKGPELGNLKEEFNDSYSPRFFTKIKYISDSNKRWREGCMCRWIEESDQIQIAVHPHWWNGDSLDEYLAKYKVL